MDEIERCMESLKGVLHARLPPEQRYRLFCAIGAFAAFAKFAVEGGYDGAFVVEIEAGRVLGSVGRLDNPPFGGRLIELQKLVQGDSA